MSDYYLDVKGPKVCSQCGSWEDLQVHHKNGNHNDDRPENLEWRCREKCHAKGAHKRYIPPLRKSETPQSQRFERENNDLSFNFKPNFR
jgi:hypothetical protein